MRQGLVIVASNAEIEAQELAALREQEEAEGRREEQVENQLSAHIRRVWEAAKRHKEPVEKRMLKSLRQINGRYSDSEAQQIRAQGLPLIYMQLTNVKSRAAKSWIRDVLMPAGDRPWTLRPTPVPTLPDEVQAGIEQRVMQDAEQFVMATGQPITPDTFREVAEKFANKVRQQIQQQAESQCERMADLIEDQFTEGGWDRHFDDVLSDIVDFPAGILKAPVVRRRKQLHWNQTEVAIEEVIEPEVERVDPFFFFPAPGVVEPDDGDCIELHEFSRDDLYALIGLPGYDEESIRQALDEYSRGLNNSQMDTLRSAQRRARGEQVTTGDEQFIEGLEFWGSVQGRMLLEWGMDPMQIDDVDAEYQIMAVLVGRHVICVRFNPDPLGRKPYSKACFEDIPGSFWGKGVPELIEDCQRVCNASARSLVANMGIASGPQVAVNTASVPPGQDITNIFPWKIWQLDFTKTGANSKPPISFFQPNPMTEALLRVFDHFSRLADEYSGIPAYTYGASANMGGAARTASGLSMLMNAASKAIKNVIKHIDSGIIAPVVQRFYAYNMLFHPDDSIKGDAQVVARGAMSLVAKEQNQMRLQELLLQTNNPIDMQIIGLDGRAAMLRRAMQGVDVGADDVIPSHDEIKAMLQSQMVMQQQMMQQQGGGQPGQMPAELNTAGQPMGGPAL